MSAAYELEKKIENGTAKVGVIGLGYVGLPMAIACVEGGLHVMGFDIDAKKIEQVNKGHSYIDNIQNRALRMATRCKRLFATCDFQYIRTCDVLIICVPTPLSPHKEPDLSFVEETCLTIQKYMRPGQLISLESTTYPGTTKEVVRPILESSGLISGSNFFLGYSPERQDPGNMKFQPASIPKVIAGDGDAAYSLMMCFYQKFIDVVVGVSSLEVAEAVKLTENIFRSVNIALVNELKMIFDRMHIDIWEVIAAASTKPFGYMPFLPGPGLGGHCIPIDPFYLSWKAREFNVDTKFIELAGQINTSMPEYVLARLTQALDEKLGLSLSQSRILIIGMAYKKNLSDIRESPALRLLQQLIIRAEHVAYHDPHVEEVPNTRDYQSLKCCKSVALKKSILKRFDAALIVTDHDAINYKKLANQIQLIIDTRNVMAKNGFASASIVKA